MDTYAWLQDVYGVLYETAKSECRKLKMHFDSLGLSNDDIRTFFEDLRYGDTQTYTKCVEVFPHRKQRVFKGIENGMCRYDAWFLMKVQNLK